MVAPFGESDRLPPSSIEAEQGILGCVMLAPREILDDHGDKLDSELFYDPRHQTIFEGMVDLHEQQQPIDLVTLSSYLNAKKSLDSVGGVTYLMGLSDATPSAHNAGYYVEILAEKYAQRKVISTCTETLQDAYREETKPLVLLDRAGAAISELATRFAGAKDESMKSLVLQTMDQIEEYHRNGGAPVGIQTGFADLDKMTRGMKAGEFWVIAARPSVGKTSLAMNIVEHVAVDLGLPVGVFSFEMTSPQLVERMMYSRTRIHSRNVYDGFLAERDFPKITGTAGKLSTAPIYIDDTGDLNILQLRARARRWKQKYDIRMIVLDYLQLVSTVSSSKYETRDQQVGRVSNGLKKLGKELGIPVIALSQLNREIEKDTNKGKKSRKPRLSDLRESGTIEQDADLVAFLYSVDPNADEDEIQEIESLDLLIAKHRNGPKGPVHLTFFKPYYRFESAAKVSAEDLSMI